MKQIGACLVLVLSMISSSAIAVSRQHLKQRSSTPLRHGISFDETYSRYPSPYAVLQQLQKIIPLSTRDSMDDCAIVNRVSGPIIGVIDPSQGVALEKEPGALFYQYFQDCVRKLVAKGFLTSANSETNSFYIFGLDNNYKTRAINLFDHECAGLGAAADCTYGSDIDRLHGLWNSSWQDLSDDLRRLLVSAFIDYLLGPETILRDQGYMGKTTAFGRSIETREELVTFLIELIEDLRKKVSSDISFPVYRAYGEIAIVLRLGPALRN